MLRQALHARQLQQHGYRDTGGTKASFHTLGLIHISPDGRKVWPLSMALPCTKCTLGWHQKIFWCPLELQAVHCSHQHRLCDAAAGSMSTCNPACCNEPLFTRLASTDPDQRPRLTVCRQVFIGDATRDMSFCKSWKSLPIRSWSGGWKLVDAPGTRQNHTVLAGLSMLLLDQVHATTRPTWQTRGPLMSRSRMVYCSGWASMAALHVLA